MDQLFCFWSRLETDRNGRCNIDSFRAGIDPLMRKWAREQSKVEREVEMSIWRLCAKVDTLLFDARVTCGIKDVMRGIWPGAGFTELMAMKEWFKGSALAHSVCVTAPPVLPQRESDGLVALFEWYDADQNGVKVTSYQCNTV